jgi:two-component system response regulator AtoC/two-component system nitrogen regulation response regulator NtrX
MSNIRVLVVDDEPSFRYTMKEVLSSRGYFVEDAVDAFDALARFDSFKPHIVITDYSMPRMNGLELLAKIRERSAEVIVIVMTAYGTEDIAVKAMKAGAWDYFGKPIDNDEMLLRLSAASIEVEALESERKGSVGEDVSGQLDTEGLSPHNEPEMLFSSKPMEAVYQMICQVAGTDVTVLVQGESGTGKEMIASAVHSKSKRKSKPFIKLNCAALPEQLIESELFGYEAGAFTGAKGRRKGKFEQANGGTIFLDEIGDMTLSTQTKVLRVLQEREIERLGGSGTVKVDVRVIAATHQNLEQKIKTGEFREDLFYRLNVVRIALPPLRDREGDIELLAKHFLKIYTTQFGKEMLELPPQVLSKLCRHRWPGNVRELENSMARAVVLDSFEHMVPLVNTPHADAPSSIAYEELLSMNHKDAKQKLLTDFEQVYLRHQLIKAEGNVSKAARMSGMHRKNFWEKLQKYEQTEGLDNSDNYDEEEGDDF